VSDYLEMNLEQLQKEHAELLAFNEKLDRERNGYRLLCLVMTMN